MNLSWRNIVGQRIPTYMCPSDAFNNNPYYNLNGSTSIEADPESDEANATTGVPGGLLPDGSIGWARGNYGVNAGYEDFDHCAWGATKKTSASNVAGANGLWSSAVMEANYGAKLQDILDGTSNTMLVCELRAGMVSNDPRGVWAMPFPGSSICNAGRSILQSQPE